MYIYFIFVYIFCFALVLHIDYRIGFHGIKNRHCHEYFTHAGFVVVKTDKF